MRRWMSIAVVSAYAALAWRCSGDSGQSDAGPDATTDVSAPDVAETSVDVAIDVPPERAIWVASETTLFKLDPSTHVMSRVADFDCSGEPMVDLAMNAREELFGITSESVVRIDKTTGVCTVLARGAQNLPYATSFIPAAALDSGVEGWFGYDYETYSSIDADSGAITFVGAMGAKAQGQLVATGDLVNVPGGKTYVTATSSNTMSQDVLMAIDPNTGATTSLDLATGASGLVGLAQWAGTLYVFAEDGRVFRIILSDAGDTMQSYGIMLDWGDAAPPQLDASADGDADASAAPPGPPSWRGAAVTTRAP